MKSFFTEFKEFALRGNVMDMAVGIIIGGAFTGIVQSLIDNFITPLIAQILGNEAYAAADWAAFGANFVGAVINFILMAFILFCLIKAMNKAMSIGKKPEEEAAPTTKICPFCKSEIPIDATRCAHCTSELPIEFPEAVADN